VEPGIHFYWRVAGSAAILLWSGDFNLGLWSFHNQ